MEKFDEKEILADEESIKEVKKSLNEKMSDLFNNPDKEINTENLQNIAKSFIKNVFEFYKNNSRIHINTKKKIPKIKEFWEEVYPLIEIKLNFLERYLLESNFKSPEEFITRIIYKFPQEDYFSRIYNSIVEGDFSYKSLEELINLHK